MSIKLTEVDRVINGGGRAIDVTVYLLIFLATVGILASVWGIPPFSVFPYWVYLCVTGPGAALIWLRATDATVAELIRGMARSGRRS